MAQAVLLNTTEKAKAGQVPKNRAGYNESMTAAYREMESAICDLSSMVTLLDRQVWKTLGNLKCEDGTPIESPSGDDTTLSIFLAARVAEMMKNIKDKYYAEYEAAALNNGFN